MARKRISDTVRETVETRARSCCEYCYSQMDFSPDRFNVEHIVPIVAAGSDSIDNLALACFGCNRAKHGALNAIDTLTGEVVPLYHPRRDQWADHFRWSGDMHELIGVSATGRATVEKMRLNRKGVVNLRRLLIGVNRHPPEPIDD